MVISRCSVLVKHIRLIISRRLGHGPGEDGHSNVDTDKVSVCFNIAGTPQH